MAQLSKNGPGPVDKIATGIPGFDLLAEGGLPLARSTLIAGTAGSGKTVFVTHFLAAGIMAFGDAGVFVTSITALFSSTTATLLGSGSVTEKHISTLTDSIILLRYVEALGRMRRSVNVLKMRGSPHDTALREYVIDGKGMHIGEPFSDVSGILAGNPQLVGAAAGDGGGDED